MSSSYSEERYGETKYRREGSWIWAGTRGPFGSGVDGKRTLQRWRNFKGDALESIPLCEKSRMKGRKGNFVAVNEYLDLVVAVVRLFD